MYFKHTFRTALRGITTNKSRSLLTMLGIIIGVGSVVLMTSIGASVEGLILNQVSSIGADTVVVIPGGGDGGPQIAFTSTLTFDDADAIEELPTVKSASPILMLNDSVSYGREEEAPEIMAGNESFFTSQSIDAALGRLFDASDVQASKPVAVIGPDLAKNLFGDQDPLGKKIKIGNQSLTVIGVTEPLGSQAFQNADERVYLPFSTAKIMSGKKYADIIMLQAASDKEIDITVADVTSLLRQRHRIQNPENDADKDDFHVRSAAQAMDILGTVTLSLTVFLSAIAGISLVVGGIGIMNIMLVAVTERTREIGLRKAVGAKRRDILLQFLIEAVLLTFFGGLIGMAMGLSIALIASFVVRNFLADYAFHISIPSTILAIVVAAGTGLLFGIYPANKAAALRPIEALRYE